MHSPIILATLNAKYQHAAFGLRYLLANLGEFRSQTRLLEFTINQNPLDIVEQILVCQPKVVGFGVYIWNTEPTLKVVSLLKKLCPELIIVVGGPEVSHETEKQEICQVADYTLCGEADFLFYEFCKKYFAFGELPLQKWVRGPLPEVHKIRSPYEEYTSEDIQNRVLYVEASRGCPFKCEYCLSSLDKSVRNFDIQSFLNDMDRLIQRGAKSFKFVDRTFNLSVGISTQILRFFLERVGIGLFIHFEMVPDRLPPELRELIQKFPPGSLQFEIGIQTWNPEVSRLVSRRQDYEKIRENFAFLTQETGVHIHADLIVGLPGETLESFAKGFDAVYGLGPDEVQVGILKRLKGTPIVRHDIPFEMVYHDHPPFQVIRTQTMDFQLLQEMSRFSRFWDLIANSGNFPRTLKLLATRGDSLFKEFQDFSRFLHQRHPQGNGIALIHLLESTWVYLTGHLGIPEAQASEILIWDYTGKVKRDIPSFLRRSELVTQASSVQSPQTSLQGMFGATPKRQKRHASKTNR